MGSGASKSGSGKAQHDEASSKQSSETRTSKTLVKRGSVERKSNGSPETPRSSKRESSMKRGNQAMDDTRGSSIRAMRGTVNKRGSFAEHEGMDGDAAKGGMSTRPSNSKSGRFDRHSIGAVTGRTSVISVHRPGSTPSGPTPRQDRHSMSTMSTVKVSRSIDAKTFMQTQREREQNRNIVGTDPGTGGSGEGRRKSRKEPSRHSLQMIHQSRQSVISLQDPNAPDVKRRMQLEEQIKRERLNKKMKSIVTVQLLRKLLDDDLGVKLRKSIPSSIVRQVPQQKRAEFKSLLAGAAEATSADDAGTTALRAFVKDVNTAHVEKLVELAEGPPLKSLGDVKTEISRASHMLSEGRVAFEVFGAGYPSEMLSSSDVPPCNQLGLMESDPWAICRALGSVDAQRHLIESKSSTIGATLLGRHLLQLSMVLTNIGNQARVNAVILIHCSNEHVDLITNDLLSHSHYGFLKENVVLVPTPPMPSFTVRNEHDAGDGGADSDAGADAPAGSCGEESKTDEVAEKKRNEIEAAKMLTVKPGLSRSYYGNGYGMLQLSWPGQGMLVINNEQRRSRIGPSLLNYLEDHGVQMVVASNINDLDKLMMPGALSLKLLSVVNDAFNEHVDKVDVANVFLEVTTDSASTSNAATDLVFDVEGKVRVLSPERMAKGVRERLCAKGGSEQLPVSCGRWYFSLTTLEKKIIPALSEMLPRLTVGDTVEGFGVGVSFSLEDLTLEMHPSGDGGGDEVNAGAGADAADHESGSGGNGLVIDLIRFDQASVSFRSESDVESAVAVLAEQDENQDFVNMGVKCNFGKKQVSGRVTSLFHRPRIMAMLCINDQAAIRPLRFLENAMSKNMDRLTLAYVMEGERETERESVRRERGSRIHPHKHNADVLHPARVCVCVFVFACPTQALNTQHT